MTLYVGDTVQLVAVAYDPLRRTYATDATMRADVYLPGQDPANVLADRNSPFVPNITMPWDSAVEIVIKGMKYKGAYLALVDTSMTGFVPGRYIYRVRASGSVNPNSEYAAFVIK